METHTYIVALSYVTSVEAEDDEEAAALARRNLRDGNEKLADPFKDPFWFMTADARKLY